MHIAALPTLQFWFRAILVPALIRKTTLAIVGPYIHAADLGMTNPCSIFAAATW